MSDLKDKIKSISNNKVVKGVTEPANLKEIITAPIIAYKNFFNYIQLDKLQFKLIYKYCLRLMMVELVVGILIGKSIMTFGFCLGVCIFIALMHWVTLDISDVGKKTLKYFILELKNINVDYFINIGTHIKDLVKKLNIKSVCNNFKNIVEITKVEEKEKPQKKKEAKGKVSIDNDDEQRSVVKEDFKANNNSAESFDEDFSNDEDW